MPFGLEGSRKVVADPTMMSVETPLSILQNTSSISSLHPTTVGTNLAPVQPQLPPSSLISPHTLAPKFVFGLYRWDVLTL